jgi:uncharacterized protein (TIGR03437 family)
MFQGVRLAAGAAVLLSLAINTHAGTIGRVIPVRGQLSDIALDERRGLIYAANLTANRIEVVSTADNSLRPAIPGLGQPSAVAMSPGGRFLVAGHYSGGLLVLDLDANLRTSFSAPAPVLAVAFGNSARAFVLTTRGAFLLDPMTVNLTPLGVAEITPTPLPVSPGVFPNEIVRATAGVSGNGNVIYALAGTTAGGACTAGGSGVPYYIFRYDVGAGTVQTGILTAAPNFGPLTVSVNEDGSRVLMGWALLSFASPATYLVAQIPNGSGRYSGGGHAFDFRRGLLYVLATPAGQACAPLFGTLPALHVMDPDNMAVLERIELPQWLTGRSVLSAGLGVMYAISESGLLALNLDELEVAPRLEASAEDLMFEGNSCDRGVITKKVWITERQGRNIDFNLDMGRNLGVRIHPASGRTPVEVTIEVDPVSFQNQQGTVALPVTLRSAAAVNLPKPLRLLINTRDFDQRGRLLGIEGRNVDVAADMWRGRFYVLRQDANRVYAYDINTLERVAEAKTGNTPVQMAMTMDGRFLLVTADNSGYIQTINLDTFQPGDPILLPFGWYPRSIAVTANAILVTARAAGGGPEAKVFRADLGTRAAFPYATLGIFRNEISIDSAVTASPGGATALLVEPDGDAYVYEAAASSFVLGRKETGSLSGAYAAFTDELYLAGNVLLDRSLRPILRLDTDAARLSGAMGIPGEAYYVTSATVAGPGSIQRLDAGSFPAFRNVRLTEAPPVAANRAPADPSILTGVTNLAFHRSLALMQWPRTFLSLSVSGVQILPPDFDRPTPAPSIEAVLNAADASRGFAPGTLITIQGRALAAQPQSAGPGAWPASLGEACVTFNGVPLPLSRVSANEILAQLPFLAGGPGTLNVKSAGGVSTLFELLLQPAEPAVFRAAGMDPEFRVATVVRERNGEVVTPSNPIHPGDRISIYLTGMGRVTPAVEPGVPGPEDPVARAVIAPAVTLGNAELEVGFAGLVPGEVGIYRIDARAPWRVMTGFEVPLTVRQAGSETTITVRVVGG